MGEREFMELIRRNEAIMQSACNKYCQSFNHADLFQEIILETWKSLGIFKKNCSFSSWLYAIARNVCISNLRKQAREPEIVGLEEYADSIAETNNAPAMIKQLRHAIRYNSVLDNIDEAWRSVFEMYMDGLSFKDMEIQTGISENTLRVNLHRIKKRLYLRYGKSENIK